MALDVRLHFEYVEPEQKFPDCEYGAYRRTLLLPFWASSVKGIENNNKRMRMKSINLFFLLINQHIVVLTTRTSEVGRCYSFLDNASNKVVGCSIQKRMPFFRILAHCEINSKYWPSCSNTSICFELNCHCIWLRLENRGHSCLISTITANFIWSMGWIAVKSGDKIITATWMYFHV